MYAFVTLRWVLSKSLSKYHCLNEVIVNAGLDKILYARSPVTHTFHLLRDDQQLIARDLEKGGSRGSRDITYHQLHQ